MDILCFDGHARNRQGLRYRQGSDSASGKYESDMRDSGSVGVVPLNRSYAVYSHDERASTPVAIPPSNDDLEVRVATTSVTWTPLLAYMFRTNEGACE